LGGIDDNVYMKSTSSYGGPERHGVFVLGNWWKFLLGFLLALYLEGIISGFLGSGGYYYTIKFNPIDIIPATFRSLIFSVSQAAPFTASTGQLFFVLVIFYLEFLVVFALATAFVFLFFKHLGKAIKKVTARKKPLPE
jgi:hypothetical protein